LPARYSSSLQLRAKQLKEERRTIVANADPVSPMSCMAPCPVQKVPQVTCCLCIGFGTNSLGVGAGKEEKEREKKGNHEKIPPLAASLSTCT
jgi:hypothetical protein